jgi:transposase
MANVLDSEKKQQILALGSLGWTLRRIQQETGVRRETASAYLKQAGIEVRPPGRWGHPAAKPAIEVITDSEPPPVPGRSPTVSACEPHREWIEVAVRHGRDAMSIWQDLVEDRGFTHSYQSVRRFVVKLRGEQVPEAHPVIETAPGEEGQVDYGDGPMVRHPTSGKYRRTRMFVFTLG